MEDHRALEAFSNPSIQTTRKAVQGGKTSHNSAPVEVTTEKVEQHIRVTKIPLSSTPEIDEFRDLDLSKIDDSLDQYEDWSGDEMTEEDYL